MDTTIDNRRGLKSPKELMIEGIEFQRYKLIWMFQGVSENLLQQKQSEAESSYDLILGISVPYRFSKIYKNSPYHNPHELVEAFKDWYKNVHRLKVYWKILSSNDIDSLTIEDLDRVDQILDGIFIFHIEIKLIHRPPFYEKTFYKYHSLNNINEWLKQLNGIDYDTLIGMVESIMNQKEKDKDSEDNDKENPIDIIIQRMYQMLEDGVVIVNTNDFSEKDYEVKTQVDVYVPDKNSPIYRCREFYHTPDELVEYFGQCYSAIIGMNASRSFSERFSYLNEEQKDDLFDFTLERLRKNMSMEFNRVNSIPKGLNYQVLKTSTYMYIKDLIENKL